MNSSPLQLLSRWFTAAFLFGTISLESSVSPELKEEFLTGICLCSFAQFPAERTWRINYLDSLPEGTGSFLKDLPMLLARRPASVIVNTRALHC